MPQRLTDVKWVVYSACMKRRPRKRKARVREKPHFATTRIPLKAKGRIPRKSKGQNHEVLPRRLEFKEVRVRLVTFADMLRDPQLSSFAKELAEKYGAVPADSVADVLEKYTTKCQRVRGRPVNDEIIGQIMALLASGKNKNATAKIVFPNASDPAKQLRTYLDRAKKRSDSSPPPQKSASISVPRLKN